MGQKVHPYGFRLGFNKTWRSRWFSDRDYAKLLHEDLALRQDLKKRLSHAGVSRIETERGKLIFEIETQLWEGNSKGVDDLIRQLDAIERYAKRSGTSLGIISPPRKAYAKKRS